MNIFSEWIPESSWTIDPDSDHPKDRTLKQSSTIMKRKRKLHTPFTNQITVRITGKTIPT